MILNIAAIWIGLVALAVVFIRSCARQNEAYDEAMEQARIDRIDQAIEDLFNKADADARDQHPTNRHKHQ